MARLNQPADVREAIVDAASALLERLDYRRMTMDDVAQEAGIGKATIYGYFAGKDEVALSVVDRYATDLATRLSEIAVSQGSPEERLRQMLRERVLSAFDWAQRHRLSMDDTLAALRPLVRARREKYGEASAGIVAAVLEEGWRRGEFVLYEPPIDVARTLLAATAGLLPYNLSARELDDRSVVAAKTDRVVDLLLRGIRGDTGGTEDRDGEPDAAAAAPPPVKDDMYPAPEAAGER
jgi:AcrR family transcriptional regulator